MLTLLFVLYRMLSVRTSDPTCLLLVALCMRYKWKNRKRKTAIVDEMKEKNLV